MKLQLNESGLRNIKEIAKKYQEAWIYGHIDFDGVTSSLIMKYYLAKYGIKTTNWIPIQYGSQEYALERKPDGVLGVLVDFSHGKIEFQIHTDHHQQQIQYPGQSKQFRHSKSNASTISSIISPSDIMSKNDLRIIDMVDSAGYAEEGISVDEMRNYVFNFRKDSTNKENQLRFGMVVNKLVLAYKNKPDYLKTIVLESKPSLMSMYNVMISLINEHIKAGDRGWSLPQQLQKNSEWYQKNQEANIIKNGSLKTIEELSKGKNAVIGNCVVQVGGGLMNKTGAYDRYTAFKLHPDSKFFIMIWDTIGMMQISTNNWNLKGIEDIDLGEIVLKQIFEGKYKLLLDKPKYDISLLALKKCYEEKITSENEGNSYGFNLNDFRALFNDDLIVSEKQQKWLDKCMKYKPSDLTPNEKDTPKQLEYKFKCCKFLNTFKIPLSEIILKTSGGHKTITNLNGFAFLNEQQRITKALRAKQNPYSKVSNKEEPKKSSKPAEEKQQYESTSLKILKSIAKDVVDTLNRQTIKESVDDRHKSSRKPLYSIGDTFKFLEDGYKISGKTIKIDKINVPDNQWSPIIYFLKSLDDGYDFTLTQTQIFRFIKEGSMEKEDKEPIDNGEKYMESTLKEDYHSNSIPSDPPAWGYDCVFTYNGYDFAIDAIVDNPNDKYYNVSVYKTSIEDDDEARITEINFDTWNEVVEYALNFDYSDDNPYKKSYEKSVSEPDSTGDEFNESVLKENGIDSPDYEIKDDENPPSLYDERRYYCKPYTYFIEHTEDEEIGEYYQVIAYKKAEEDKNYELEEIDNVAFSTWQECIGYMKSMRTLYLIRKSNFMDRTDTEPEDDGSELNESLDDVYDYKSDIIGTEISRDNGRAKYIITQLPEKDSDPEYFHIKEVDGDREILITEKELKDYFNFDVKKFIEKFRKDPDTDGSELDESIEKNNSWEENIPSLGNTVSFKVGLSDFKAKCIKDNGYKSFYELRIPDKNNINNYEAITFDDWNDLIRYVKAKVGNNIKDTETDGSELDESASDDRRTLINRIKNLNMDGELRFRVGGCNFIIQKSEDYDDSNERDVTTYTLTAFDDDWDTYDYCEIFEDTEYLLDSMFEYVHSKSKEIKEPDEDGSELDETKASRFNKHLDDTEKSFATISAERSMPQIHTRSRQRYLNHKRTEVLEKLLKAWGLKGYIKTKGGFDEKGQPRVEINGDLSEEDSFFVPNITKEQAVRLGKLFNQDSVMFKDKGSNQVKELRTNLKGGDEGIGNETGLVFIVGQGRHNIGHDKTYYSRPKGSMIKFAFNPEDESSS